MAIHAHEAIEVNLRGKNQMTLPEAIAERLGVKAGDRLLFEVDGEAGVVWVRPLLRSYAGLFPGLWGDTPEESRAYIDAERASWEE